MSWKILIKSLKLTNRTNYFESFSEYGSYVNNYDKSLLNVLCLNIRSANANFDELLLFLENYANSKKLDVIVLTETWHDSRFVTILYLVIVYIFQVQKKTKIMV